MRGRFQRNISPAAKDPPPEACSMRPKTAASGRTASGGAGYAAGKWFQTRCWSGFRWGDRSWRRDRGRVRIGPARQRLNRRMMDNRKAVLFMICDPEFPTIAGQSINFGKKAVAYNRRRL